MKSFIASFAALVLLAGCATAPSTIVQGPTSARPMLVETAPPTSGAIYNANSYRPMFEDRRARHIGDLLTINISERTSANKSGASSGNKNGSASFAAPGVLQSAIGASVALEAETKFAEKQVAMNKGVEFIRFSGMVSPDTIQPGNIVSSTVVADARVEYRTNSRIDRAEVNSMLSRFFLSMLPF